MINSDTQIQEIPEQNQDNHQKNQQQDSLNNQQENIPGLLKEPSLNFPKKEKPILRRKTYLCKHKNGCLENMMYYTSRNFLIGMTVKLLLNLNKNSKLLVASFKNPAKFTQLMYALQKDVFKYSMFPALYTLILKFVHCALRKLRNQEDGKNAMLAGFIAGYISLKIKPKKDRTEWVLVLLSRACDCLYRHYVINKRKNKDHKYDYLFIFAIFSIFHGWAWAVQPSLISDGVNKFTCFATASQVSDDNLRNLFIQKYNRHLYFKGNTDSINPQKYFEIGNPKLYK